MQGYHLTDCPVLRSHLSEYGHKSFGQLTDITHDSAWEATDENQPISLDSIVGTLPNAAEVIDYLHAH